MNQKDETKRVIPLKNYLLLILMFIAVILITLYIFKWYQIKKDEKISQSYLVENNLIINTTDNVDELNNVLTDNSRLLLYISYRNSIKVYNIEKKYDYLFKKYNLKDIFYLFDITSIKKNNKNYISLINNYLDIDVTSYPAIIYFEDGQITSYKKINNYKDLENFIKKINIEKNSQ